MYQLFTGSFFLKALLASTLLMLVSACSTQGRIVNTYEGETLPKEQLAIFTAPENITVVSVNGKEMPSYLFKSISTNYGLLSGTNHVVVKYESIWAKPGSKSKGESQSETTESKPVVVSFDAMAGETYRISFEKADNLRDARALADNFSAQVINGAGLSLASSKPYKGKLPESGALSLVQKVFGGTKSEEKEMASSDHVGASNLQSLKEIWEKTSPEARKAFLAWAFKE